MATRRRRSISKAKEAQSVPRKRTHKAAPPGEMPGVEVKEVTAAEVKVPKVDVKAVPAFAAKVPEDELKPSIILQLGSMA